MRVYIGILGGSWVVISGVISRVTITITHISGLITPLITTHEPPSMGFLSLRVRTRAFGMRLCWDSGF